MRDGMLLKKERRSVLLFHDDSSPPLSPELQESPKMFHTMAKDTQATKTKRANH